MLIFLCTILYARFRQTDEEIAIQIINKTSSISFFLLSSLVNCVNCEQLCLYQFMQILQRKSLVSSFVKTVSFPTQQLHVFGGI